MRQRDLADRRVERREQQILGEHPCPGQRVEQARFAGIGVADKRHHRQLHRFTVAALLPAHALDLFESLLEQFDALFEQPAIAFDLRLARTAEKAEAAALPLKVGPRADKPALLIVEMGEFDLQNAFTRHRAFAEDFEDQCRTVKHLGAGLGLEIALLHRAEGDIDEQQLDFALLDFLLDLFDMARADEGRRLDLTDFDDFRKHQLHPDRLRQAFEFGLAHLDRMTGRYPAHVGDDQPDTGWRSALVDKCLWTAWAVLIVEIVCHDGLTIHPRVRGQTAGSARRA